MDSTNELINPVPVGILLRLAPTQHTISRWLKKVSYMQAVLGGVVNLRNTEFIMNYTFWIDLRLRLNKNNLYYIFNKVAQKLEET